ncbi:MAG: hypothetical protein M3O36_00740 [Myxococcota bacterium]|nr:hypothetical protein [Myxococcota bacterium]
MRELLLATIVAGSFACSSRASAPSHDAAGEAGPPAFQGEPPSVYVAKVKNILVGLPPTDDEVKSVDADPTNLGVLVDGWLQLPQYGQKMMRFFELAFQQTQVSYVDFADQVYPKQVDINASTTPLLVQNAQESFARTMLQLTAQGRPLTEAMSTRKLMMTTAMKELYALLDVWEVDDAGKVVDRFRSKNPTLQITVEAAQGPIPVAQTLDPTSPNYMHWYDPDVATADMQIPGCQQDPLVYPASAMTLHYLMLGALDGHKTPAGTACPPSGGTAKAPQLTASDFSDWTLVTIRTPNAGEPTTSFYDLPSLRSASELVLSVPRIGFFSTPAFFANWQTNISNQMRVTMHQTLIVATGSSIDGTDLTTAPATPGTDPTHDAPTDCFGCHKILDPTRSIFSASWSWNYHSQLDPVWSSQPGLFAFRGVIQPVASLGDFGNLLASHPLVGSGWVQKLCYYVNSAPCDASDPEFQSLVSVFQSSGYSWNTLVKTLVMSPITTNTSETKTRQTNGEVVAVSRRDHLCAALNARLGFSDACGLDALGKRGATTTIPEIVSGLPSDAYGRGAVAPLLPNRPTLFFRAGIENICEAVAAQVVDAAAAPAGVKQWSSAQPDAALSDFVSTVMALTPSDPRAAPLQALLKSHFTAALQTAGVTATEALRSTFVVACLAPSTVSIGL